MSPGFYLFAVQVFVNTVEKGEIAPKEQFLLFPLDFLVFYPFRELSAVFVKVEIIIFKLFQFGSLRAVLWEMVNSFSHRHK